MRVASLSDILKEATGLIFVQTPGGSRAAKVQLAGFHETDKPDITLVADGKKIVGEFEDQRVKLDLDHLVLRVKDVHGIERQLVLDTCPTA